MKDIRLLLIGLLALAALLAMGPAAADPGDTTADQVFGQPDFTHGLGTGCNLGTPSSPTASSLCFPFGVAVGGAGSLYVADRSNNRVLEYDSPLTTDSVADRVFGQPNFTSGNCNLAATPSSSSLCFGGGGKAPSPVAVDGAGNLYVADMVNNRVLEYDNPLATDTVADRVFGQGAFTTNTCNTAGFNTPPSASTLCSPVGVAVDSAGNLYVADIDNNRVLEYDDPLATDTVADRVFGQGDFTTNTCNTAGFSSPPTASTLCSPDAVGMDSTGNLYVADTDNNRVLGYDNPLTTDRVADRVFGQGGFTTDTCNTGGFSSPPTASSLCRPLGVALDGAGSLYVADSGNNRVLEYDSPLTTDTLADRVIGQGGSFTSNICNLGGTSAASLCNPQAAALDSAGNLYVADGNSRVLEYDNPLTLDTVGDRVFGQPDFISGSPGCNLGTPSSPTASSLCNPSGVAVDSAGNLYVADNGNNRVLEYDNPLTTDHVADRVFGQGGFTTNTCNTAGFSSPPSASTLCSPHAVGVDSDGNLYIADSLNNRVLEYDNPLATDTVADRVFGQEGFTTNTCNTADFGSPPTASTLCFPEGVTVDGTGNLYVADIINNRVLEYDSPMTTDTVADRVFGQGGSFASKTCNLGGVGASSLCLPDGVAVDSAGNLYVADSSNHRVLEYDNSLATDTVADRVFGQGGSFTSNACNLGGISARSLCVPGGLEVDAAGNLYVADPQNNRVLEYDSPVPVVIVVQIDIKPGGDPNSTNLKPRGTIPVAILSSPDFDAPSEVDKASLTFGPTGDEESLAFCTKSDEDVEEDVNVDGLLDLVCHFHTRDTGFQCGDTEGVLRGETLDGVPIEGSDSVRIVPCR